jgi:hypothetical protein
MINRRAVQRAEKRFYQLRQVVPPRRFGLCSDILDEESETHFYTRNQRGPELFCRRWRSARRDEEKNFVVPVRYFLGLKKNLREISLTDEKTGIWRL